MRNDLIRDEPTPDVVISKGRDKEVICVYRRFSLCGVKKQRNERVEVFDLSLLILDLSLPLYFLPSLQEKNSMASTPRLLEDKVIIVTGGSQGIGEGIVRGLAEAGAKIVIHYLATNENSNDVVKLADDLILLETHFTVVAGDIALPSTAENVST